MPASLTGGWKELWNNLKCNVGDFCSSVTLLYKQKLFQTLPLFFFTARVTQTPENLQSCKTENLTGTSLFSAALSIFIRTKNSTFPHKFCTEQLPKVHLHIFIIQTCSRVWENWTWILLGGGEGAGTKFSSNYISPSLLVTTEQTQSTEGAFTRHGRPVKARRNLTGQVFFYFILFLRR